MILIFELEGFIANRVKTFLMECLGGERRRSFGEYQVENILWRSIGGQHYVANIWWRSIDGEYLVENIFNGEQR